MKIQEYIDMINKLTLTLLEFIDNENECQVDFSELIKFIQEHQLAECKSEFRNLIRLLIIISNDHHRNFLANDIYYLFKSNKRIFLFILQNQFITIDETIIYSMELESINYYYYFYNVIEPHLDEQKREMIKESLLKIDPNIFDNFEEKQKIGENDNYICQLIRNDSIIDFITFINKRNISVNTKIEQSIFETNSFLIDKNPTLIEYAAFYGSIQIFQYLKMNNTELNPSLWIYAIHGQNYDIIHLLEELKIEPEDKSFYYCLREAIKCHHNEIAKYIQCNLLIINDNNLFFFENDSFCYCFCNFATFSGNYEYHQNFFYMCQYNCLKPVIFITKTSELNANSTVI